MNEQPKIGCVNHDCDKCKAVQEPVAIVDEDGVIVVCNYKYKPGDKLYTTPPAPQPVPVKTYHDGKPWPVQPKPWVGLTDEERDAITVMRTAKWRNRFRNHAKAVEQLLKEKNHDQ